MGTCKVISSRFESTNLSPTTILERLDICIHQERLDQDTLAVESSNLGLSSFCLQEVKVGINHVYGLKQTIEGILVQNWYCPFHKELSRRSKDVTADQLMEQLLNLELRNNTTEIVAALVKAKDDAPVGAVEWSDEERDGAELQRLEKAETTMKEKLMGRLNTLKGCKQQQGWNMNKRAILIWLIVYSVNAVSSSAVSTTYFALCLSFDAPAVVQPSARKQKNIHRVDTNCISLQNQCVKNRCAYELYLSGVLKHLKGSNFKYNTLLESKTWDCFYDSKDELEIFKKFHSGLYAAGWVMFTSKCADSLYYGLRLPWLVGYKTKDTVHPRDNVSEQMQDKGNKSDEGNNKDGKLENEGDLKPTAKVTMSKELGKKINLNESGNTAKTVY
eukprot:jgi/Psemu1/25485/gm1.25485_g